MSDNYKALTSIEAIRVNTGMFIGDTQNPNHLVEEVIDNMLDEIANKYADTGIVHLDLENKGIWISDNGRGIKIGQTKDPDTGELKDNIELLVTKLFSGSKFRIDNDIDYKVQIGMHGVGLTAVNALSNWFVVNTRDRIDKSKVYSYQFKDAILVNKEIITDNSNYSTLIGFSPNGKYFDSVDIDIHRFASRLILSQCLLEHSKFIINDQELPKIGLQDFIKSRLQFKDHLYSVNYQYSESEKISIYFNYTNSLETISHGCVNLRECEGTFITNFQTVVKNTLKNKIDKKFKNINANELLCGLRSYIVLTIPKPKFDSQTKSRMTLNVTKNLLNPIKEKIEEICSSKSLIATIESILERKYTKKVSSVKTFTKRVSSDNKLRDCENIPGQILYIVEGDSAGGSLKQARDVKTEAYYPLRGKGLNVEKASFEKLEKNKEFKDLKEAFGPVSKRRYNQVKILPDADADGYHIASLTILMLAKLIPDMIKAEKVSLIIPPLYGAKKGKQFIPLYDQDEILYFQNQKFEIIRFKGLGEMNPDQLRGVVDMNMEYVIQWPKDDKLLDDLMAMVVNTEVRKVLMNNPECCFDKILKPLLEKD